MRVIAVMLLLAVSSAGILGCSPGRRSFNAGLELEQSSRYEEAMYSYVEAMKAQPEENEYRVRFLKARDRAAWERDKRGEVLMAKGDYAGAMAEFQTAWGFDSTQGRYHQSMERASRLKHSRMFMNEAETFEKQQKFREAAAAFNRALELDQDCVPCKEGVARVAGHKKNRLAGFELTLKSAKPMTLKFKDAKIKQVFSVITQLSGINFVFDEALKDQNITLSLENATFQQSLDLLTSMFKLGRKTLNESTVIIYPKTPDKIKQYEDMVVRTFHLDYMDAKKAVALIRTLVQVRKIHINEESNSFMVRDTQEVANVIEKIIDMYDLPESEVVLDIEIVEITDNDTEKLGLLLSNYNVQLGAFTSAGKLMSTSLTSTTSSSSSTTSAGIDSLLKAFTLKGYGGFVTVPYATYNFGKSLTKGEVLSNPKIRVKNREKSKFNVGTRVPITTTTTTNGTVSVNVQYVDVGVKVSAEPFIQVNNEVTIKLGLEVSSVLSRETVGSTDSATVVATIGTRNLDTVLSLKDGETSVIGGLISNNINKEKKKVYLLGDIPLLGPLLSSNNTTKDKTELVLSITPRLVRGITVPDYALSSIRTGREDDPSLMQPYASFEQEPQYETGANAPMPLPTARRVSSPRTPQPAATVPAVPAPVAVPVAVPTVTTPIPVTSNSDNSNAVPPVPQEAPEATLNVPPNATDQPEQPVSSPPERRRDR